MKTASSLEFTPRDIPDYAVRNLALAAYELTQSILRHARRARDALTALPPSARRRRPEIRKEL